MSRRERGPLRGILALIFLLVGNSLFAGDVKLAWDEVFAPTLAGYRVYLGRASRSYGTTIDVGNNAAHTVTGLGPGTYFFAVTAYDVLGNESGFSNEVSATIGGPPSTGCDFNGDGAVNVLDLQLLANAVLGIGGCPRNCDLNLDGGVNVLDLQVLANVILGLRSCP